MATNPPSGFTQNYTDPGSGITLIDAWIQILNILYVPSGYCLIVADVYKDQASYQEGKTPVFENVRNQSSFDDAHWNTYFDASVMDQANRDIQAQSILFLQEVIQSRG